ARFVNGLSFSWHLPFSLIRTSHEFLSSSERPIAFSSELDNLEKRSVENESALAIGVARHAGSTKEECAFPSAAGGSGESARAQHSPVPARADLIRGRFAPSGRGRSGAKPEFDEHS